MMLGREDRLGGHNLAKLVSDKDALPSFHKKDGPRDLHFGCESLTRKPPGPNMGGSDPTHNGVCSASYIGAKFAEVILAVCQNPRDLPTSRREGGDSPVYSGHSAGLA